MEVIETVPRFDQEERLNHLVHLETEVDQYLEEFEYACKFPPPLDVQR